jgi:branched-subunit amino acid ABC-type transport system permease component
VTAYLVSGVVDGCLFALLAVALVLVYQITGVLNFAFGALGMVAVYIFSTLALHMNSWAAFGVVFAGAAILGVVIGVAALPAQSSSTTVKAVATLGVVSALQGLVPLVWGVQLRRTPTLWNSVAFRSFGVGITWQRVLSVVVTLALSAFAYAFFRRGNIGAALRAMATSPRTAQLVGLPIRKLWISAWAISTAVAAGSAMLVLPEIGFDPGSQTFIILIPIAAALVANLRSVPVAFVVALVLGIGGSVMQGISSLAAYRDALPLAVVLVGLYAARTNRVYERV